MKRTSVLLILAALPISLSPSAAQASDGQGVRLMDLTQIDRQVAKFVEPFGGQPQPVDRRLRLSPCGGPLALGWHGTEQKTVEVACPQQGGWRIYLAVRASRLPGGQATGLLVRPGDRIVVRIGGRAFSVTTPAEALTAGGLGAIIAVRVKGAATILRARVEPDGTATVAGSAPSA